MTSSAQDVLDALTAALTKAGDNVKRTYSDTRRLGQEVGNYLYSALDKAGREVAAPALQRQADLLARAGTGPVLSVGDDGQLTGRLADLAELVTSGMAGPVPGGALGAGPAILPKVVKSGRNTLVGAPPTANNPLLSSANEVVNNLMPGDFFSRKAAAIPPSYHAAQRPRIEDPIRVYHGSPHDFTPELEVVDAAGRARFYPTQQPLPEEVKQGILSGQLTMREHPYGRFSLDKIGTGEGAQAYRHGLYFAEHEPVAKGYRDSLANRSPAVIRFNGKDLTLDEASPAQLLAGSVLTDDDPIRSLLTRTPNSIYDDAAIKQAIEFIKNNDIEFVPPGRMYAANLHARPEQFLDWDRPLAQQPDVVRNAMEPFVRSYGRGGDNLTAGNLVNFANTRSMDARNVAEETLRSAGVPGIRYLDEGSRIKFQEAEKLKEYLKRKYEYYPPGAVYDSDQKFLNAPELNRISDLEKELSGLQSGWTSNYVVFDPNIIEIARKYALPAALAGSGAYMMSNPAEAAPFTPPQGWFDVNNPRPPRPNKAPLPPEQGYSYTPGEYVESPPSRTKGR